MATTSMTSKYMSFSPQLVNERNAALNKCPTKSGRSQIYRNYYLKMRDAYENYEEEEDASEADASEADASEADASEEDEDASEEDESEADASEADASEADASEADEEENEVIDTTEYCCCDKNEFGCPGCNYEWRDGYKNGWNEAMKYIAIKTHKEVPDTPACSYCGIVCKTRKCGGKCGGTARYCSIDCQKQDWEFVHKKFCNK